MFEGKKIKKDETLYALQTGDILEFEVQKIKRTPFLVKSKREAECQCTFTRIPTDRAIRQRETATCDWEYWSLDHKEEFVSFNPNQKNIFIDIGGERYSLYQKNFMLFNENKKMTTRFKISSEMLKNSDIAKIVIKAEPYPKELMLGWKNPRHSTGRKCTGNQRSFSWKGNYEYHLIISLTHNGIEGGI